MGGEHLRGPSREQQVCSNSRRPPKEGPTTHSTDVMFSPRRVKAQGPESEYFIHTLREIL